MARNPLELIELCKAAKNVYIQTHNFPDPDAIASSFALQALLEKYGVKSTLCHEGKIDKLSAVKMLDLCGIEMKPYADIQSSMAEEDMIILVDCQKNNGNTTDLVGDEQAFIDHHPTFVEVEYKYSDLQITGACASIITDYYRLLEQTPSTEVATALLYGLRMDTLQLSRGVTEFDIDVYAFLFKYADAKLLTALESNNMEFTDLRAYGSAIDHIKVYGKVGFSFMDFDCPDALIGILSDFLLSLQEVEVAIIYAYRPDGYKFSIRSETPELHAGDLIHGVFEGKGSGGGHAAMAGGFISKDALAANGPDTFNTVQEMFMKTLNESYAQLL